MRGTAAALLLAVAGPAQAGPIVASTMGVRHTLEAAMLSAGANVPFEVNLYIFVSSHAVESNFAREVAVHFDRLARDDDDGHLVWRDGDCHQRRGYPKVTPLAVEGRVGDVKILARPRTLGRSLPRDELATGGIVTRDQSGERQNMRWRFTTGSGLVFAMHVSTETCRLGAAERTATVR